MTLQACRRCLYVETHPLGITFEGDTLQVR